MEGEGWRTTTCLRDGDICTTSTTSFGNFRSLVSSSSQILLCKLRDNKRSSRFMTRSSGSWHSSSLYSVRIQTTPRSDRLKHPLYIGPNKQLYRISLSVTKGQFAKIPQDHRPAYWFVFTYYFAVDSTIQSPPRPIGVVRLSQSSRKLLPLHIIPAPESTPRATRSSHIYLISPRITNF